MNKAYLDEFQKLMDSMKARFKKDGCYLVQGKDRIAVYDLTRGKLISMEKACYYELGVSLPSVDSVVNRDIEPSGVWLDLTERCNLACIHCYAAAGRPFPGELGLDEWKKVVNELIAAGHYWFTLAGGEPLVVPWLPLLLDHILKKAEKVVIITNATLLTERRDLLDQMENHWEKTSFLISFYSHDPEQHEKITSKKGSWQKSVNGIKELLKRNIAYNINIPICSLNEKDSDSTMNFLASLGVEKNRMGLNVVYPMGRGCAQEILPSDTAKFNIKKMEYGFSVSATGELIYRSCWSGKLLIMADGRVTPCPSAREKQFVVGNVLEQPVKEILQSEKLMLWWHFSLDEVDECQDCEFRYGCHHCPPMATAWKGNVHSKNPYCFYFPREGKWMSPPVQKQTVHGYRYFLNPAIKTKVIGDKLYLYTEEGELHFLNLVAREIYDLICQGLTTEEIIENLSRKYNISKKKTEADVLSFLKEMEEKKLILTEEQAADDRNQIY